MCYSATDFHIALNGAGFIKLSFIVHLYNHLNGAVAKLIQEFTVSVVIFATPFHNLLAHFHNKDKAFQVYLHQCFQAQYTAEPHNI